MKLRTSFLLALWVLIWLCPRSNAQWVYTNGPYGGTVNSFAVSPSGAGCTNPFAGTSGGGVWTRPSSEMITSAEGLSTDLPSHFNLSRNFPNPLNPTTTIRYELATISHVALKVFDILGREVTTLVNGVEEPRYKSVRFDGGGLASGVYLDRLQANRFVELRGMISLC
jgi:hypothetical protein